MGSRFFRESIVRIKRKCDARFENYWPTNSREYFLRTAHLFCRKELPDCGSYSMLALRRPRESRRSPRQAKRCPRRIVFSILAVDPFLTHDLRTPLRPRRPVRGGKWMAVRKNSAVGGDLYGSGAHRRHAFQSTGRLVA